jgi:periplasmic divalent cation tolerance protein
MYSIYYVTAPNIEIAKDLSHKIIEQNLAACANIFPGINSIYKWEGKVCEEMEVVIILKSTSAKKGSLFDFINQNHPYETPCILEIKIDNGNAKYLEWLGK